MIRLARKYAEKFNFQVNLAVADVCYLPYNNEAFDYIISVATYHHLKREQQLTAFQELKRVLKPGGRLLSPSGTDGNHASGLKGKRFRCPGEHRMKHCIVIIICLLMGN